MERLSFMHEEGLLYTYVCTCTHLYVLFSVHVKATLSLSCSGDHLVFISLFQGAIIIEDIFVEGNAYRDGRLLPGDHILEVTRHPQGSRAYVHSIVICD